MVVPVTCKNGEDSSKNKCTSGHNISNTISLLNFFLTLMGSELRSQRSDMAEC